MLAFLDMPSGISGDMFLGCLVAAGWPVDALRESIRQLRLPGGNDDDAWSVTEREVMKGALRATKVDVHGPEEGQPHRHLSDIRALLEGSALPAKVKEDALAVFTRLAEAEGAVHGVEPETIHFHEVGALDSIIDIVGACAGMHALGLEELYAGAFPLGHGMIEVEHGPIPLPAPATLELLARAGAPVRAAPGAGELVTPTGAALVCHFVGARWRQPELRLQRIATGAGQKDLPWPNVARLWLGEPLARVEHHHAGSVLIETNIDDMNPEFYSAVATRLLNAGARDVWWLPVQMKKGRPGIKLSVLAPRVKELEVAHLLLRETTTLGMRVLDIRGHAAERRIERVDTPLGVLPVKLKLLEGRVIGAVPEFDACLEMAEREGLPLREVYEMAAALAWQRFLPADPGP